MEGWQMRQAMVYVQEQDKRVQCQLCAHRCIIAEDKLGVCGVRKNVGGRLYTLVYGRIVSQHVDPVEKKPLYHFYPGSTAYSIATPGCNFHCRWCQNHTIARAPHEDALVSRCAISPERIVTAAQSSGSQSIAYTYTEPTVFFEYAYDTARLAHQAGLANIYVTNGYMTDDMLAAFDPYLDSANVDLKAFRDETYRRYVGARLQPVLDSMKTMRGQGIWLEVTTLVIPDLNDDPAELRDVARFIVKDLGPDTPWHISRFHPAHEMLDRPPTPTSTLQRAREIGLDEGLKHIYVGNVPDQGGQDTICPDCGCVLIQRHGFHVSFNHVQDGCCPDCGRLIEGVGMGGA